MLNPSLKITDGTQEGTVNLLALKGWTLKEWKPSVAEPKGGGVFRSSPLVDGRRLAYRKLDNITDTFNLIGNADSQDLMIATIQRLQRLLEKATSYWTSNWQLEPVWIEARASAESMPRYATIVDYRLSDFGGPFEQPFFSASCNSATEAILVIEHSIWQETIPGEDGNCVPLYCVTDYPDEAVFDSDTFYPKASLDDVTYDADKGLDPDPANVRLYIGYSAYGTHCEAGIIFNGILAPAGSTLLRAILRVYEGILISATPIELIIEGQSQGTGRINSTTLTSQGSDYQHPVVQVYDDTGNGHGAKIQAVIDPTSITHIIKELNIIDGGQEYESPRIVIQDLGPGHGATATATATNMNLDAATFDGTVADYTERERTRANVTLSLGEDQIIPYDIDITNVIGEIISSDKWTGGDNVGIFIRTRPTSVDNSVREIYSFDNVADMPELYLEWTTASIVVGRDTTCAAEVFISNKNVYPHIDSIYTGDANGGGPGVETFSDNMHAWDFGSVMPLFQEAGGAVLDPIEVGDRIYFGATQAFMMIPNLGPFTNIIFDLYQQMSGITGVWKYWNGAWTAFDVSESSTKELCGDEVSFGKLGVGSIVYEAPVGYTTKSVNGKTGYWVCFEVTAVDTPVSPYQWHRDIYTANKPYIDISSENVPGDIPALARIIVDTGACLAKSSDTIVMGLRSLSRGQYFSAYLDCSDYQLDSARAFYTVYDSDEGGRSTSIQTDVQAPSGQSLLLTNLQPIAYGHTDFDTVCEWRILSQYAKEYVGTYHAYVRGVFTNTLGSQKLRIKAIFGEEHNVYYSDIGSVLVGSLPFCLDLGQLIILPSSPLKPSDVLGPLHIYLEVQVDYDLNCVGATIHDVILIPADEWSGNFGMPKIAGTAVVEYGHEIDIDGITTPRSYRAIQKEKSVSYNWMIADWTRIASGEPIFQQNADQRLWFLQLKHSTNPLSYHQVISGIRAERSARYLLARGNG